MNIQCYKCGKNLGEIRDATLRKNIYHICCDCAATKKQPKHDMPDFFKEIFK